MTTTNITPTVNYLTNILSTKYKNETFTPLVCVICGSGLSYLDQNVDAETRVGISYSDIPGFPQVTVKGHAGEMVFGKLRGTNVMILRGRFHSYEGHTMDVVTLPVRVATALKCKFLLVTNVSGGINSVFNVGDLMFISDHIGIPLLAGKGPLIGPNDESIGPRFPSVSDAYDVQLRNLAISCASDLGMSKFVKPGGTYVMVSGPQFETPAECVMLRNWGADCVGMSTVPEVVVAKHAGLRILGLSLICNKVILPGDTDTPPVSHAEVLATTAARSKDVQELVETILQRIPTHLDLTSTILAPIKPVHQQQQQQQQQQHQPITTIPFTTNTNIGRDRAGSAADNSYMVMSRLRELDVTSLTPLQSLKILSELKALSGSASSSSGMVVVGGGGSSSINGGGLAFV
jgi:purine-nucleoside phosphorylase